MDQMRSLRERELAWLCLAPGQNGLLRGWKLEMNCCWTRRCCKSGEREGLWGTHESPSRGKLVSNICKVQRAPARPLPQHPSINQEFYESTKSPPQASDPERAKNKFVRWEKKEHQRRKERSQEPFSPWSSNFRLLACSQLKLEERRHFNCKLKLQQFSSRTPI